MTTLSTPVRVVAGATAALAAAAVFNEISARRAEARFPPIGRIIDVDGVGVHVVDTGEVAGGETIVLVHGNGSLVEDFLVSGLVDRLRTRNRVILFDRPGYGHTPAPADREWTAEAQAAVLVGACDALDVTAPVVVGHSWGVLVALAWALDHPRRVSRLVLLSGYYYGSPRADSAMLGVIRLPVVKQVFDHAIAPLQTRLTGPLGLKQVFSPAEVPPHFIDNMPIGLMLRPSQIAASARDGAQMPANAERLSARYGEFALSIAVVWGEGDKLVGQDGQSRRFADSYPLSRRLVIKGGGHMVHHKDPAAVAALIETI